MGKTYENWNVARKGFPDLQDGDTIKSGNFWQKIQREVPQDLTLLDGPNMFNCKLTGNITSNRSFQNGQLSLCYWEHLEYDEDGNPSNPLDLPVEPEDCPHVDPALVDTVKIDNVETLIYDNARADRPIGWTP